MQTLVRQALVVQALVVQVDAVVPVVPVVRALVVARVRPDVFQ